MSHSVRQYLEEDHVRLGALLDAATADPERFDAVAFEAFRAGLLRHIGIEEKLLLSTVRKLRGGVPLPEATQLRIEHAALTSLLVPTPDASLAQEIRELLLRHDAREEGADGIYAACEAVLGDGGAELGDKARAYPPVPTTPHFDGDNTVRTAERALTSAARIRPPRAHV